MNRILLGVVFVFTASIVFSQTSGDIITRLETEPAEGEVRIIQDETISYMFNRYVRYRKNRAIKGYRIRIFSDSGKNAETRARNYINVFRQEFPYDEYHARAYLEWDLPNFKVYVGDFRTKTEALRFQKIIAKEFPYGFYVRTNINLPDL
jgi:hypothetical protein